MRRQVMTGMDRRGENPIFQTECTYSHLSLSLLIPHSDRPCPEECGKRVHLVLMPHQHYMKFKEEGYLRPFLLVDLDSIKWIFEVPNKVGDFSCVLYHHCRHHFHSITR